MCNSTVFKLFSNFGYFGGLWYTPESHIFWRGPKALVIFLHYTKVPQRQKVVRLSNVLALTADKMYSLKGNKHTEIGHKIQGKFKIYQEKNNVQNIKFCMFNSH